MTVHRIRPSARSRSGSVSGNGLLKTAAAPRQRDVRERILKAATRLLAKHGFDGTTLQAVADEVGIRKPSVLHHFPSKDVLRREVLDRILQHWNRFVPKVMLNSQAGSDRFGALANEMVRFYGEDPDVARLVLREMLDRPAEHRRFVTVHVQPWFAMIGEGIEEGKRRGAYRLDVDAEVYLAHVLRLIIVAVATSDTFAAPSPNGARSAFERQVRELVRIARTSLFGPEAKPPPKR